MLELLWLFVLMLTWVLRNAGQERFVVRETRFFVQRGARALDLCVSTSEYVCLGGLCGRRCAVHGRCAEPLDD